MVNGIAQKPIEWVQIDVEADTVSHTEDPERTNQRIMARQQRPPASKMSR